MILGVGTDICHIPRIQALLETNAAGFFKRCFDADEVRDIESAQHPAARAAKYFAAKEAYAKARGTGFRDGFTLKNIAVRHDAVGKPCIVCGGEEVQLMAGVHAHLSLSDDGEYATAFVVLERRG